MSTTSRTNQRAKTVRLTDLIAPSFYGLHRDVANGAHTFYKLAGGRGSTKSSFVGTEIPLGMMRDAAAGRFINAAALRRYGVDLKDSVYAYNDNNGKSVTRYEVWSDKQVAYLIKPEDRGGVKAIINFEVLPDGSWNIQPHNYGRIPFIEFRNNAHADNGFQVRLGDKGPA